MTFPRPPRRGDPDRPLLTEHHDVETAAFLQRFMPEALVDGGALDALGGYQLPDALDNDDFHEHVATLSPAARVALLDRLVDQEWQRLSVNTPAQGQPPARLRPVPTPTPPRARPARVPAPRGAPPVVAIPAPALPPVATPKPESRPSRHVSLPRLQPRYLLAAALVVGWGLATYVVAQQHLDTASQPLPVATVQAVVPTPIVLRSATRQPTVAPTLAPTDAPLAAPTLAPAPVLPEPTVAPTLAPALLLPDPTAAPTVAPTLEPTLAPTTAPTAAPTVQPTAVPTVAPTVAPTAVAEAEPQTYVAHGLSAAGVPLYLSPQLTSDNAIGTAYPSDVFVVIGEAVKDPSGYSMIPVAPLNVRPALGQHLTQFQSSEGHRTFYLASRDVSVTPSAQ